MLTPETSTVTFWQRAVVMLQVGLVWLLVWLLLELPWLPLFPPGITTGMILSRQALQALLAVTLVELQTKRVELDRYVKFNLTVWFEAFLAKKPQFMKPVASLEVALKRAVQLAVTLFWHTGG